MIQIFATLRKMFHYVKGKNRFLVHAEFVSEGVEYTIEKDLTNNTIILLSYYPPLKRAAIKFLDSRNTLMDFEPLEMKSITKTDFNILFMTMLLGITNIQPFENEDKTAN